MHFFAFFSSKNLEVSKIYCTFALDLENVFTKYPILGTEKGSVPTARTIHFYQFSLLGATLNEKDCKDTKSK